MKKKLSSKETQPGRLEPHPVIRDASLTAVSDSVFAATPVDDDDENFFTVPEEVPQRDEVDFLYPGVDKRALPPTNRWVIQRQQSVHARKTIPDDVSIVFMLRHLLFMFYDILSCCQE